ncbi:MAG: 2'-5' RNA ligase family protein [Kastovskya adunca ATA6-11-RM4]|jgi:2'-5' RNA ligase|nr:2'-5' RNA ligase family protein [Kastovskya adunca ATA6-11-RM4]
MDKSKQRFFIALLPPQDIREDVNEIKQYFGDRYASRKAQNSPPHITLQPPFDWQVDEVQQLERCLKAFADTYNSVPITLRGFGAFVPRVIYINVVKTAELLALQQDLMAEVEESLGIVDRVSKSRPFAPHMTVAFRDLTKQNFRAAWQEFQQRQLEVEFTASGLTLLIHNGQRWIISAEFPFQSSGRGERMQDQG